MNPGDEPPRRTFGFKPKEFERLNPRTGVQRIPADSKPPAPSLPSSAEPQPVASTPDPALHSDVLSLLQLNRARAEPTEVVPVISPWHQRQRRLLGYLLALLAIDVPAGVVAFYFGHSDPFLFVPIIGGAAYFTGLLTWKTWFLKG